MQTPKVLSCWTLVQKLCLCIFCLESSKVYYAGPSKKVQETGYWSATLSGRSQATAGEQPTVIKAYVGVSIAPVDNRTKEHPTSMCCTCTVLWHAMLCCVMLCLDEPPCPILPSPSLPCPALHCPALPSPGLLCLELLANQHVAYIRLLIRLETDFQDCSD